MRTVSKIRVKPLEMLLWVSMSATLPQVQAATHDGALCRQIRNVLLSPDRVAVAVPFEEKGLDEIVYKLDLDRNGVADELEALCGHGADATCEMKLTMNGVSAFEFSLPASIRVISFQETVFIVTGLTFDAQGKASARNYSAHQLGAVHLRRVCNRF